MPELNKGGRGRKTPTALKELHDYPDKRKRNKAEPQPRGIPSPPKVLGKTALAIWKETVANMPPNTYKSVDTYALASYCEAAARWSEATEYFANGGATVVPGYAKQDSISPWVKIQSDAARLMSQLSAKLGFTPVDRQILSVSSEAEAEENPFQYN